MKYDLCFPPLNKDYFDLSQSEAEALFRWYMEVLPKRVDYVRRACSDYLHIHIDKLNLSAESLLPIWIWFLSTVKMKRTPCQRLEKIYKNQEYCPIDIQDYMTDTSKIKFSIESEAMIRDIGMYVGSAFVQQHKSLSWGIYHEPKKDFFVNKPLITGFRDERFLPAFPMTFEPIHMVHVQASKIIYKQHKEDDLYRVFMLWEQYVGE